jgi:hypothetical protein
LTEIESVTTVTVLTSGNPLPSAAAVTLPVSNVTDWEPYEGMRVNISQALFVTEHSQLGRFGQVFLSSGDRLRQFTHLNAPSDLGYTAHLAEIAKRQILLDDGSTQPNPDPIIHPDPGLSASNTLRGGDTVTGLEGVLDERFGDYRIQPTNIVNFTKANPRPMAPSSVGGTLKVGSFNLLNYFNGDGMGGGFPTSRGADTLSEFTRQRDKIISAITAMSADVIGLMELENDGYRPNSAIQDLVSGLNNAAGFGTYAFIDPAVAQIGTDEIAVGFIYKPGMVTPVGSPKILDSSVAPTFDDTKNRPTLAQTFSENATGERLTVVVNHFKSKGAPCDDVGDPDTGDGQGNCNETRTEAANALVNWLATDPTGSADPDFLIIGDLNSYAMEDPITAIKSAGYTNLIERFHGSDAYSFVFGAQWGYLNHALSSAALTPKVTGVTEWHINADEPSVLDYNEEFKSAGQITSFYNEDPYRFSDHDPVIIGLNLAIVPLGFITIAKTTAPSGGGGFTFSGDLGTFTLGDGGTQAFNNLPAGDYTVTESPPAGWQLAGVSCTGGNSDLITNGVIFRLGAGENMTCTFSNRSTETPIPCDGDDDGDGSLNSVEDAVPDPDGQGTGDGNGDGQLDRTQRSITSLMTFDGAGWATIANTGGYPQTDVRAVGVPADAPSDVQLPSGLFEFTVSGFPAGQTVDMVIAVARNEAINGYWKKNNNGKWENIATSVEHDGVKTKVAFPVADNGRHDKDPTPGVIQEPGGPGIQQEAAATPCANICEVPQAGVTLIPPECFMRIGQYVEALGVVVDARLDGEPVTLTPPPDTLCRQFDWSVYNLGGEEISDDAGQVLDGTRCFSFKLTGSPAYYHVEASCVVNPNEICAFGVLVR